MDFEREDKLLILELKILADQAMERSLPLLSDVNGDRSLWAAAQVALCRDLMIYLNENEDWSDIGEMLEGALEGERSRYLDAWGEDDRKVMTIAMAHVRILNRLIRRLTNPVRREELMPRIDSSEQLEPFPSTGSEKFSP